LLPLHTLGLAYLRALPQFLTTPLFYVVIALIVSQYMRSAALERKLWGRPRLSVLRLVLLSLAYGVVGGLLGSLLLLGVGVALSGGWMLYVWMVALALAFVSPRLMCFAYAGGFVALSSLFLGWPALDIPSLLALVALLHAVESVLMYLSGHIGAVPVSVKNSLGEIVAGFSLQKFWPVPLLALAAIPGQVPPGAPTIAMPDWWPLILPHNITPEFGLWMIPVVAGLGYGELAITTTPKQRARQSAGKLAIYSLMLFLLAWSSARWDALLYAGALFAPLGHELLVWTTNRREMQGQPLYSSPAEGLRLLDVLPSSPAAQAGFRQGDVLLSADQRAISTPGQLELLLGSSEQRVLVQTTRGVRYLPAGMTFKDTGLIPVPTAETQAYLESRFASPLDFLARLWDR